MVRYPVIEGARRSTRADPLRMMIHANTPYRVTVDVKGNHYRAFVEGQEADFWTEDRLKTGGVGFFSEAGERAQCLLGEARKPWRHFGKDMHAVWKGQRNRQGNTGNGLPACRNHDYQG